MTATERSGDLQEKTLQARNQAGLAANRLEAVEQLLRPSKDRKAILQDVPDPLHRADALVREAEQAIQYLRSLLDDLRG